MWMLMILRAVTQRQRSNARSLQRLSQETKENQLLRDVERN